MGIASFSSTGLRVSLQGLVGWLTASASGKHLSRPSLATRTGSPRGTTCASHANMAAARPACPVHAQAAPQRPLRVLRVVDTQQATASTGRMRISGRMADVCAELDRLAALEAGSRSGALLQ